MIDFSFTEEQELFRRTIRDFVQREILPQSPQWDKSHEYPKEIFKKMGELGIPGVRIPVQYGGSGLDRVTSGIAAEEVARGDLSCGYSVMLGGLLGDLIDEYCVDSLKEEWLPRIASGESVVALGLTEPSAGSDAASIKLKATRDGDEYVLNGEKTSISMCSVADAIILFARTGTEEEKHRGVSAFLVPLDLPGITTTKFNDMGHHAVGRGSVFFDNVRIPAHHLMSEEGTGFIQVMVGFDYTRALIGLMCLGVASQSVEDTIQYVKDREAFGKPIARFEGVSFPIAEALTRIDAARWQCYRTLWLKDNDLPHTAEAAMCKWWSPRLSVEVIHDMLLLHGHYGYTDEFPIEQRLRDVIGLEIGDGTAQIQKIVIAREHIGKEYKPY
jgi:cyclohexanecarboxyl-CoA dehydrogenase